MGNEKTIKEIPCKLIKKRITKRRKMELKIIDRFYKYFLFLVATNPSAFSVISPHLPTEIRISRAKRHSQQLKMRNKSPQAAKPPPVR
jgi:hypothetical protein